MVNVADFGRIEKAELGSFDINHPTKPAELVTTLEFYSFPMHLQWFQMARLEAYIMEFGDPPVAYHDIIRKLIQS